MKKVFLITLLLSSVVVESKAMLALAMAANAEKVIELKVKDVEHFFGYDEITASSNHVTVKKNADGSHTVTAKKSAHHHDNVIISGKKEKSNKEPKALARVIIAHKNFNTIPANVHVDEKVAVSHKNIAKIKTKGANVKNHTDHSTVKFYKKGEAHVTAVDHDGNETTKVVNVTGD